MLLVLDGKPVMASVTPMQLITSARRSELMVGRAIRICAATPATCGVAMEVPEIVLV